MPLACRAEFRKVTFQLKGTGITGTSSSGPNWGLVSQSSGRAPAPLPLTGQVGSPQLSCCCADSESVLRFLRSQCTVLWGADGWGPRSLSRLNWEEGVVCALCAGPGTQPCTHLLSWLLLSWCSPESQAVCELLPGMCGLGREGGAPSPPELSLFAPCLPPAPSCYACARVRHQLLQWSLTFTERNDLIFQGRWWASDRL